MESNGISKEIPGTILWNLTEYHMKSSGISYGASYGISHGISYGILLTILCTHRMFHRITQRTFHWNSYDIS
jgi:hypothetical protein